MSANVYSSLLYASPFEPAGSYSSDPVPAGFVWVVRELEFVNNFGADWGLAGFVCTDSAGNPLMSRSSPYVTAGVDYHKSTRQVLNPADSIAITVNEDGWAWRISGYVLKLP